MLCISQDKKHAQGDGLLSWLGQKEKLCVLCLFMMGALKTSRLYDVRSDFMHERCGSASLSPRLLHEDPAPMAQSPGPQVKGYT